ncbi:MAG TPA: hypothetical protein VIX63_02540, partial [Vicinamibacterales bacterium]
MTRLLFATALLLATGMEIPRADWQLARGTLEPQAPNQEQQFLSRVRRLTVEGRRAGEGYWSPDGQRLVFQSEREPGNP